MCNFIKYPYSQPHPPPKKVYCFAPLSPGNSSLASYFASKISASKNPSPWEFPMTFHGVGMDFFWNCSIASPTCMQLSNSYNQNEVVKVLLLSPFSQFSVCMAALLPMYSCMLIRFSLQFNTYSFSSGDGSGN